MDRKRGIKILFHWGQSSVCSMFNIAKKELEKILDEEGIPADLVGKGANKMFSAKKVNKELKEVRM